jgi:hypothetical protein
LCNWEQIALPKSYGGWGIRNIFYFSNSLAANTFWRVLNGSGIWHRVICDKYLQNITVVSWLRSSSFQLSGVSIIWSGMIKFIHLITHGLYWSPGNGKQISLGKDQILGMGKSSFITKKLQASLDLRDMKTLDQIKIHTEDQSPSTNWMSSNDLALSIALEKEWYLYTLALIKLGATLIAEKDNLMWSGGDDSGISTTNFFYMSIMKVKKLAKTETWRRSIWHWKMPLKIKVFIWFTLEGKIITWDSLQKRGWEGLGRCPLCKSDSETISHLFIHYVFARTTWAYMIKDMKVKDRWKGNSLLECMKNWHEEMSTPS